MTERVDQARSWLLHHRPYRETSLLLEVFSRDHGRVALVANGARRPKSRLRSVLQPFQSLSLSWTQRGELGTLRQAELDDTRLSLQGDALYAGFYLNELLMRLCHRGDPHPELHDVYEATLAELATSADPGVALRLFERDLLEAIGYGLQLDTEADTAEPIKLGLKYRYDPHHGPRLATGGTEHAVLFSGAALMALKAGDLSDQGLRVQAKKVLQLALNRQLDNKPLRSVQMLKQMRGMNQTTKHQV